MFQPRLVGIMTIEASVMGLLPLLVDWYVSSADRQKARRLLAKR